MRSMYCLRHAKVHAFRNIMLHLDCSICAKGQKSLTCQPRTCRRHQPNMERAKNPGAEDHIIVLHVCLETPYCISWFEASFQKLFFVRRPQCLECFTRSFTLHVIRRCAKKQARLLSRPCSIAPFVHQMQYSEHESGENTVGLHQRFGKHCMHVR